MKPSGQTGTGYFVATTGNDANPGTQSQPWRTIGKAAQTAKAGDTVYAEFIRDHGYGVHHLGVLVEDMEAAVRDAKAAGYRVTMDGGGFGLDGDGHYAYLDTEDGLGTTLELIQRPSRRAPPEKIFPPPEDSVLP